MSAPRTLTAGLRPVDERGNVVAAGSVALATLVYLLNVRFNDKWGVGIHLTYSALAAAVVLAMAAQTEVRPGPPRGWQSALYVVSFVLVILTLLNLADVLGADDPGNSSGTLVWVGTMVALLMAWFARTRDSGISTLLAALTCIVVANAFVDWVFSPDGVDTFRWVLLLVAIGLAMLAAAGPEERRHHAVGFVNAAGVAMLVLALTFAIELLFSAFSLFRGGGAGSAGAGWGWELCMLAAGFALVAYAVLERRAGPGYLGAANLVAFLVVAAGPGEDGPSLIGWPLVLIVVTGALLAAGLRRDAPDLGEPA